MDAPSLRAICSQRYRRLRWSWFDPLTTTSQGVFWLRRIARYLRQRTGPFWAALVAILFIVFLLRERREVVRIFHVLRNTNPLWLIGALAIGLVIQSLMGTVLQPILRRMSKSVSRISLVRIQLQRHVISTIIPIGGPASTYAAVRALDQQGVSSDTSVYAMVLNGVLGYVSFAVFLIPVLAYLIVGGGASTLMILAAIVLCALVVAMVAVLILHQRGSQITTALQRRLPARVSDFVDGAREHHITTSDLITPLLVHLVIDLLGVVMLYACLEAVHQEPSIRVVLAGYVIGTLFLLVTPVMQGLGVVELSMTVVLTNFGVPSGAALAAVLLYRVAEVWMPLLVGLSMQVSDIKEVRRASAHIPAVITGITGLVTVLAAISHPFPRRFDEVQQYSVVGPHEFSRTFAVVAGFFLIFLSWSLWRRKRMAWIAALAILAVTSVGPFLKGHDHVLFVLSLVNAGLLLLHRDRFRVRSDVPTMRQGVIRFGLSILFAVIYGTVGFFLIDERAFGTDFSPFQAVTETLRLFFSLGTHGVTPHTRYGSWFEDSLSFVGLVSVIYATFSLVRPVVWRRRTLPSDRHEASRLIDRWGDSSLDFFKTWDDKLFFFSSNRRGVVSFGQTMSSAIALGDPVATNPGEFNRALKEYLEFCDANDWGVAFHQVPPAHLPDYAAVGLSAIKIGEEAIVDVTDFSLQGRPMKALRSSINRLEREGYRTLYLAPPFNRRRRSSIARDFGRMARSFRPEGTRIHARRLSRRLHSCLSRDGRSACRWSLSRVCQHYSGRRQR